MRSVIPLLLVLAPLIAGCDRQSGDAQQANAAMPGNASAAAAAPAPAAGKPDRSHKGTAAPSYGFTDAAGKRHSLADFRGKPVLVNLWATWCAPCVKEMPALDARAGKLGGRIVVLAISQDSDAAKAKRFFADRGVRHLGLQLDPESQFSFGMGVNLPTTILYDATGHELWRIAGDFDWAGDAAAALIAEAR